MTQLEDHNTYHHKYNSIVNEPNLQERQLHIIMHSTQHKQIGIISTINSAHILHHFSLYYGGISFSHFRNSHHFIIRINMQ